MASFRNCLISASSMRGATHTMRHPGAVPFLGRTFYGVPQKASERVAKRRRRKERLRGASALRIRVRPEGAQEYRPLVPKDGIKAWPSHAHARDEIIDGHAVVTLRAKDLRRLPKRVTLVEVSRPSPRDLVVF